MKQVKGVLDKVVGWVLVVLMAASVVNVLWQVFTRFVLEAPSSFTEELARYLLIWIGVLGAGYVVGQRAHLALELLPEKLTGRRRQLLEGVIQISVVLFAAFVLVLGGIRLVYVQLKLGQMSPSLGVPLGWVYLVLPISGLLMVFYGIFNMTERWEPNGEEAMQRAQAEEQAVDGQPSGSPATSEASEHRHHEEEASGSEENQSSPNL